MQNALTAIKYGAKWIDSTIQGMGRGAGNVATEDLLCEINHIYKFKYNLEPIFNLSQNEFKKLKQSYKWGKIDLLPFICKTPNSSNIYSRIIKR